jgi:hypothetical protein
MSPGAVQNIYGNKNCSERLNHTFMITITLKITHEPQGGASSSTSHNATSVTEDELKFLQSEYDNEFKHALIMLRGELEHCFNIHTTGDPQKD